VRLGGYSGPHNPNGRDGMSWKTPKIVEVALGAEINSYACAGLK
jgi:coenzyme PQQ precursor peptide PqqA